MSGRHLISYDCTSKEEGKEGNIIFALVMMPQGLVGRTGRVGQQIEDGKPSHMQDVKRVRGCREEQNIFEGRKKLKLWSSSTHCPVHGVQSMER